MSDLTGKSVLIFCGDAYEDLELWYPKLRLTEAGAKVTLAGAKANTTYSGKHGYPCVSDAAIADMQSADFQGVVLEGGGCDVDLRGVVLAGGWMPDKLRRDPKVLSLIREFDEAGKMIAAICHGGWMAISANVYKGVRVTGSPGIKDDCVNAGAIWDDKEVIVDGHHVSSRKPDDLPAFCKGMIGVLTGKK